MWESLILLGLTVLEQGLPLIDKWMNNAEQVGEMTPQRRAEFQRRRDALLASRAAKTDDQVPASQGGTGPG